ncbi:hypothetical protein V1505DRAFT_380437 [Lipomyces doorenjongii]
MRSTKYRARTIYYFIALPLCPQKLAYHPSSRTALFSRQAYLVIMKLLAIVMLVTFIARALATPADVYLKVKSQNSTIDGMGLISMREGDALNYVFLAAGSQLLVYESANSTIYDPMFYPTGPYPFYLELFGSNLVVSIGENPTRFRINSNGYLTYNGSVTVFYAAKNTSDPYDYSLHAYQALYSTESRYVPIGSIPFTVYAELVVSTNLSTTSSAALTTSAKPSTATAPYSNATSTSKNNSTAAPTAPASTGAAAMNEVLYSLAIAAVAWAMLL